MRTRGRSADLIGVAVALVVTVVTYTIFFIHPWPHTPLNQFLAMFDRNNAAVWPMQIVWYVAAAAMVGLALRPTRRASQLVCVLAAAYLAWIGIAYFAWLNPGMNLSWAWAAVFTLEAVLVLVAGVVRSDLVFRPRWNLASALGGAFIRYALVAYPAIGLLGGHPLHTVPVFGLSPCTTVILFFGLLLSARPPAPKYLLPLPLAWALTAAPPALGTGIVADVGMGVAGVTAVVLIVTEPPRGRPLARGCCSL